MTKKDTDKISELQSNNKKLQKYNLNLIDQLKQNQITINFKNDEIRDKHTAIQEKNKRINEPQDRLELLEEQLHKASVDKE